MGEIVLHHTRTTASASTGDIRLASRSATEHAAVGHIIHIGFPKAASNFLRRWFEEHPQLAFADGAIGGFHSVYELSRWAGSADANLRYRVTSSEGLAEPHADVGSLHIDFRRQAAVPKERARLDICRRLYDLFPNAKILIVTRGFRGAIHSAYGQYVRAGGTERFDRWFGTIGRHWFDYDSTVTAYAATFGSANVIVLPFEWLRDDPESFCQDLERRLGIDHHPLPRKSVNVSVPVAAKAWYPLFTKIMNRLAATSMGRNLRLRYLRALRKDRLAPIAELLQRIFPLPLPAEPPERVIDQFRGRAETLRRESAFAPYAHEYLFAASPDGRQERTTRSSE